jgi:hypothetical protein
MKPFYIFFQIQQQLERPRFSLDRLVPPELQESPSSSSNNSSIWADFTLRRPSARGQCQGTVYVHWHQENSRLDFSMENGGGQKGKGVKHCQFYQINIKIFSPTPILRPKIGHCQSIVPPFAIAPSSRRNTFGTIGQIPSNLVFASFG